jgi:hypothetical protein
MLKGCEEHTSPIIFHPSLCLLHIQLLLQQIQAPHKQLAMKRGSLIPIKSLTKNSGEKMLEVVAEIRGDALRRREGGGSLKAPS